MPRRATHGVGRAGEHYVAAELNRLDVYATPFSGNLPGIDIVATSSDGERIALIQVKTKRPGGNWQVGLKAGWEQITPNGCPGNGTCGDDCKPKLSKPILGKANHYWVFVSLQKDGGQHYFIVPDGDVRHHLVREKHLAYLDSHGGQRPGGKHDSEHHAFKDEELQPWRDKWEILGLWDVSEGRSLGGSVPRKRGERDSMAEDQYRALFEELGIEAGEKMGLVLGLGGRSMALYFNPPREGTGVHFVAYMENECHYPAELWERIDPDLVPARDRPPRCFPTRPWPGLERRAFEDILASPNYPFDRRLPASRS